MEHLICQDSVRGVVAGRYGEPVLAANDQTPSVPARLVQRLAHSEAIVVEVTTVNLQLILLLLRESGGTDQQLNLPVSDASSGLRAVGEHSHLRFVVSDEYATVNRIVVRGDRLLSLVRVVIALVANAFSHLSTVGIGVEDPI